MGLWTFQTFANNLSNNRTHLHRVHKELLVTALIKEINNQIRKVNYSRLLRTKEVQRRKLLLLPLRAQPQFNKVHNNAKIQQHIEKRRVLWQKQIRHSKWIGERLKRLTFLVMKNKEIFKVKANSLRLKRLNFQRAKNIHVLRVQTSRLRTEQGLAMERLVKFQIYSTIWICLLKRLTLTLLSVINNQVKI